MHSSTPSFLNTLANYKSLFSKIELREIIESAFGIRCSRLALSDTQLEAMKRLSKQFGIALAIADYKIIDLPESAKGRWADTVIATVPLTSNEGLYLAYLSMSSAMAQSACIAEKCDNGRRLGEILGIPHCCINSFLASQNENVGDCVDYTAIPLRNMQTNRLPLAGATFFGQYFDSSFISHFPCSLYCHNTDNIYINRHEFLVARDSSLAHDLNRGHQMNYLYISDMALLAAPQLFRISQFEYRGQPLCVHSKSTLFLELSGKTINVTLGPNWSIESLSDEHGKSIPLDDFNCKLIVSKNASYTAT